MMARLAGSYSKIGNRARFRGIPYSMEGMLRLGLAAWLAAMVGAIAPKEAKVTTETATFAGGCFWCTEAVYQEVDGVLSVESGYSGGSVADPTYEEVCTGRTGHAEAVQITYDPVKVRYEDLLEIFFKTHDPTTLNRQGADAGTQYRSAIFTHGAKQKAAAERIRKELDASRAWDHPLVTEIIPFKAFYKAEEHHQEYYRRNGAAPYCLFVIRPKMEKFRKVFKARLKKASVR
jgi:peptide-methionine (S)-S-oxide reductase